jgi:hypothetical protein
MSDEALDENAQFGPRLLSLAQRLGIDVERAESWEQLATLVSDQLGGKCYLCATAAAHLSFWIPRDPSLFDLKDAWVVYIHCGEHAADEIAARIAEKHARTS